MSEQKSGGSSLGDQVEQVRQRVMNNETVQSVIHHDAVKRVMDSDAVKTVQQQIQAQGPDLVERIKALASEAMVRRIAVQQDGRTLFEFPLALGLGGALLAPQLAAIGALAALIGNCTITVEREETGGQAGGASPSGSSSSAKHASGSESSGSDSSPSSSSPSGSSTGGSSTSTGTGGTPH